MLQFTGLKDKNRKESYQGDLVEVDKHGPREVFFEGGAFYTRARHPYDSDSLVAYYEISEIKIIGNVYENPELLQ